MSGDTPRPEACGPSKAEHRRKAGLGKPGTPVLHRDDPDRDPLSGHVKVTREDWLNQARNVLVNQGVGELKILALSRQMGVSRSSFYWYFKNRADLLSALLQEWEARNTRTIVQHCEMPAPDITDAVCHFFRCFVDPGLFDRGLDFAVRDWARRDPKVQRQIESADTQRLAAITAMFRRYEYDGPEADIRARILYFMQIGYHAVEMRESIDVRISRLDGFLFGFTGKKPSKDTIDAFRVYAMSKDAKG